MGSVIVVQSEFIRVKNPGWQAPDPSMARRQRRERRNATRPRNNPFHAIAGEAANIHRTNVIHPRTSGITAAVEFHRRYSHSVAPT
jgi:hypothetical protein